jgi:hypothetical protein
MKGVGYGQRLNHARRFPYSRGSISLTALGSHHRNKGEPTHMTTSIIDGSIETADLRRSKGGASIFRSISFQQDDGASRTIRNAVVKDNVAAELVPGARGRFYLYNAFDLKGVHGVRTTDGREVYGFAGNNQKIFLIVGIFNVVWIAFTIAVRGGVPLLGVATLILSVVGYIFMSKGQREAQAQFDGDTGHRPLPPA